MKNKIIAAVVTSSLVAPIFVYAQASALEVRAFTFTQTVGKILGLLIPMAFALAVLYFFYGLAKYILHSGDEENKVKGKEIMINGILALFIMVSIYGIINLLGNFIGIGSNSAGVAPTIALPRVQ